jgi:hypothetical protein
LADRPHPLVFATQENLTFQQDAIAMRQTATDPGTDRAP